MGFYKSIFLFCLIFIIAFNANSQDYNLLKDNWVVVNLYDGSNLYGKVKIVDSKFLHLKSLSTKSYRLPLESIVSIEQKSDFSKERIQNIYASYNNTKHISFINNNAFLLKSNEKSYTNFMLLGHKFDYGISNRFNFGFGFEVLSLFFEEGSGSYIANFKFSLLNPSAEKMINSAFVFNVGLNPGEDILFSTLGLSTTIGSINNHITFTPVLIVSESDNFDFTFDLSMQGRIGEKTAVIYENITILVDNESLNLGILAMRFYLGNSSLDLGIFTDYQNLAPVPALSFSMLF